MAEIKSAIEIALEKTKEVVGDPEILIAEKYKTEGKKLISRYLGDATVNLASSLKGLDKKKLGWMREGMKQIILANLVLPQEKLSLKKLARVGEACISVGKNAGLAKKMFAQLESFFDEYLNEKEQVVSTLEDRYAPRLKQKEEELSKKMGQPVHIDMHMDPEFNNILKNALSQTEIRYGQVLEQVKGELSTMLD